MTDNQLAVQDDLINDASVLKRLLYSAYLFVEIVLNEPHTSSLRQQSTQQPETRKLFAFLQFSECGSKSHPLRGIQLILCFPSHFRTRSQSAHTVNHSDKVLPSFLFNSVHLLKSSLLACGIFLLRTASVWVKRSNQSHPLKNRSLFAHRILPFFPHSLCGLHNYTSFCMGGAAMENKPNSAGSTPEF